MSAIQQLITATAGGHALPSFTITSTIPSSPSENDSPIDIFYDWSNFQGQTVYWSIAYGTNCSLFNFTGDKTGTITLNGDGTGGYFYVYPKANNVTTGDWYFSINVGSTVYGTDYGTFGPYLVTDSSTTPSTSLVFDIDPANITDIYANGGAGFNVPDTGGLNINGLGYYATTSASAGGSLVLNGSGEYVVLPDLVNSNYPSVTVSAWIKPVSPTGALNQTILAKETCYKLRINGDGSLSWGVSNNGSSWTYTAVSSTGLLTGGQWCHVAATVDVSHATIYLNGQQIAQTTGVSLAKNSQPFVIGAYANQYGASDYFAGSMGEVKMWNFAATDSDVANEYNNTVSRYIRTSGSFSFSGVTDQYITVDGTTTDWAMGKTGTFEWWEKSNIANIGQSGDHQFGGLLVQGNAGGSSGVDIFQKPGINTHFGNNSGLWPEPSTSTWVHMAVTLVDTGGAGAAIHVYYDGVEQTLVTGQNDALLSNSTDALHIGTRVPGANYQNWVGLITNIHISTATLYTGNFTPTIRTTLTTGTVFLMNSAHPLVDVTGRHTISGGIYELSDDVPVVSTATMVITSMSVGTTGLETGFVTVHFTANISTTTTGTMSLTPGTFFTAHSESISITPGANTFTYNSASFPGVSQNDIINVYATVSISSGINACTSNQGLGSYAIPCFPAGTLITMADGTKKAIEYITVDDDILVWDFDRGVYAESKPIWIKVAETSPSYNVLTFSDGSVLKTVGHHHIFNKQAERFTHTMTPDTPIGTISINEQGEEIILVGATTVQEPVEFYNVWTDYHLNLFAQGVLTSNRFNNTYPIVGMKFVKDHITLRPLEEFADIDPKYISGLRLQEQPEYHTPEYIKDYVHNRLERLDIATASMLEALS